MAQRQWRSDDTDNWLEGFGTGADGSSYVVPSNEGCYGTASTKSLTLLSAGTFSNNDLILIHQTKGTSAGVWELNKILSGGGGTSLTLKYDLMNTYTDNGVVSNAQVIELKEYDGLTSGSLSCPGWDGAKGGIVAWFDKASTTIDGTLTFTDHGFRHSTEYKNSNGPVESNQGEGSGTGTFETTEGRTASGTGAGGGGDAGTDGGGNGSGGGSGGSKSAGSTGYNVGYSTADGGQALWETYGSVVSLGGGAGGRVSGSGGDAGSAGTDGSGIAFIYGKSITITGTVALSSSDGDLTGDSSTYSSGAGGAGSIILSGEDIDIGTAKITASGGQAKGTSKYGGDGGIVALYSSSITGSSTPTLESVLDTTITSSNTGNMFLLF